MAKLFAIALIFGPWLVHVLYCFVTLQFGFLIAGALFIPIGWLHGLYLIIVGFLLGAFSLISGIFSLVGAMF